MARIHTSGAALNSAAAGVEIDTVTGAGASISTLQSHSGTMSYRVAPAAATAIFLSKYFAANQATIGYFRFYLYVDTFPGVAVRIAQFQNIAGANVASLQINAAGQLRMLSSGLTTIGLSSSAISTGKWYRIEFKNDATTNPGTLEFSIDGAIVSTAANSVQGNWARVQFGCLVAASPILYFDDIALNDSTGVSQTGYPGAANLAFLQPNAQGDSNGFATNVGGTAGVANNFSRVDEVPPDDATSYNASVTLNNSDLFKCNASGIPPTATINAVVLGVRFANITATDATTGINLQVEKTAAGTIGLSANLVPNSTAWITNATGLAGASPFVLYNDPDGNPWTQSKLDTMQMGYILDAAGVNKVAVSNIWAYVDYVPINATQTTTTVSRIQNSQTATTLTISRISKALTATQATISRITSSLTSLQLTKSRIQSVLTRTTTSISRISNRPTATTTSISNISSSSGQTHTKSTSTVSHIVLGSWENPNPKSWEQANTISWENPNPKNWEQSSSI